MALYTNHTRFPAVVTVQVVSALDEKAALKLIQEGVPVQNLPAGAGHHDFLVDSGKVLDLTEGTQATVFAVRASP